MERTTTKRIGFLARYDNSGLGTLSWEFTRHLKFDKILLIKNGVYETFPERYEGFDTQKVDGMMSPEQRNWILTDIDILFTIETFYDWGLVAEARKRGIKTILYTMYEMTHEEMPYFPDLLLCPSKLDYDVFKDYSTKVTYLPVPVATDRLIHRTRHIAKTFIHSGSHGGMSGRKGTYVFLEAIEKVKTKDIKFKIFTWSSHYSSSDPRVEIINVNFKNYWQMWREGDMLVYPQDYNGICLPVIEAMSSGLGVITTDIYPFNEYLPKELLFGHDGLYKTRAAPSFIETDAAKLDPQKIADKIDEWANKDISEFSLYGKKWAKENSWDRLLPKYQEVFNNIW